jgi:hypothetical protein
MGLESNHRFGGIESETQQPRLAAFDSERQDSWTSIVPHGLLPLVQSAVPPLISSLPPPGNLPNDLFCHYTKLLRSMTTTQSNACGQPV